MLRKIIRIDREKCNGCGICANACHEGAIGMAEGKAVLLREDYCDGLGDCLPACPTGAITFEMREALAYNEEAVLQAKEEKESCGCAGSRVQTITRDTDDFYNGEAKAPTRLMQWPVQIKLAPIKAPYFNGANLLIAADCSAYAYGDFHNHFMRNHITLIGCPKLDGVNYAEKLTEILKENEVKSVTIVRMEVPCCGGLENAVKNALQASGKFIPWRVVTIGTKGNIILS